MAFLGDFGKVFLGGRTTQDVGGAIGSFVGSKFGGIGGAVGREVGRDIGRDIGEIGANNVDVSAPPAGIDSAATTLPVSQTGMIMPQQRTTIPSQAFIGGAGLGALATQGVGALARTLSRPGVGGLIGGLGAGAAAEFVMDQFGNQKKLVITRKLQRDVKKVFMLSGGDVGFISMNSMMLFGKDLTEDQILRILFKTFKNQGPYVTKAAVRKTRQTIRKMETLCDLKDRLAPPKRRAPARRRTMSTSITQVK
tara:strand:+ start:379 stop:1134 length:756 start_codon:yes stop_codon:yes gene_type:complete